MKNKRKVIFICTVHILTAFASYSFRICRVRREKIQSMRSGSKDHPFSMLNIKFGSYFHAYAYVSTIYACVNLYE